MKGFLQIICLCGFLFCNVVLAGPERAEKEKTGPFYTEKIWEGARLLTERDAVLSKEERKQIMDEMILSHLNSAEEGSILLRNWASAFSKEEGTQIIDKVLPLFKKLDKGARFLAEGGSALSDKRRKQVMDEEILPYIRNTAEAYLFLQMWSSSGLEFVSGGTKYCGGVFIFADVVFCFFRR